MSNIVYEGQHRRNALINIKNGQYKHMNRQLHTNMKESSEFWKFPLRPGARWFKKG